MDTNMDVMTGEPLMAVPNTYFMIALRGLVAMPNVTMSFDVARQKSLTALNRAIERNEHVFLVAQKHAGVASPAPKDIHRLGCIARIKQVVKLPNDVARIMVEGIERATITSYTAINPCFEVEVAPFEDKPSDDTKLAALRNMMNEAFEEFTKLDTKIPADVSAKLDLDDEDKFCFNLAPYVLEDEDKKQSFLGMPTLEARMECVLIALNRMLEILRVEKKLAGKVRKAMEQSQKEYFLREQAKAIHEELGDGGEELDALLEKAEELQLPDEPMEKVKKEIARMERMNPTSPEAGVSRSYVEWLLDIPWHNATEDNTDLAAAQAILDEDHFGLDKVKQRIVEYIAVMTLTKRIKGPILCFVGPPGVGKTSIVRSIARALGRKFVQMSLGGVKDEAEIRGHRRTYIGAIPGSIMYHMKHAGSVNPVFLLDEIDKMSSDYRGDPASAMLEVLDPEQNSAYRDHYLEVAYDLSKVLFVTTANSLDTIPAPLLDRMEVIELSGYTDAEKTAIAEKYLVPKQCEANGLGSVKVDFDAEALRYLISAYTRESGVRNCERNIGTICRKLACRIVGGDKSDVFRVDKAAVEKYLGVPKYLDDELRAHDEVGEVTGLAWTSAGGTTLPVEVALIKGGKGDIILTGKLGDVMKESARTAISVVRTRAAEYGIDSARFGDTDIHIHVPEGAVPKDGPSAGITIATAVMSAFSGRPVDRLVAMTGEITLRGNVLAIGGLKEKMLAAHRMGIKTLVIPSQNVKDLAEIPAEIKESFDIHAVDAVDEVFRVALKG